MNYSKLGEQVNYSSKRIAISFLAVQELQKHFEISPDAPPAAYAAVVEKLIFLSCGCRPVTTAPNTAVTTAPNRAGLAAMAKMQH